FISTLYGIHAPYPDRRVAAGRAIGVQHRHTSRSPLKHLVDPLRCNGLDRCHVDAADSTGNFAFLHRAVTDDDDFFKRLDILDKSDTNDSLTGHCNLLAYIADIRKHQDGSILRKRQRVTSFHVGYCSDRSSFYQYRHTRKGLAGSDGGHSPRDGTLRHHGKSTAPAQEQNPCRAPDQVGKAFLHIMKWLVGCD